MADVRAEWHCQAGCKAEQVAQLSLSPLVSPGQTCPSRTRSGGDICTFELVLGTPGSDLINRWDFVMVRSVSEYVQQCNTMTSANTFIFFPAVDEKLHMTALPCSCLSHSISSVGSGAAHSSPKLFPEGCYCKCSCYNRDEGRLIKPYLKDKIQRSLFWATGLLVCIQSYEQSSAFTDLGARSGSSTGSCPHSCD